MIDSISILGLGLMGGSLGLALKKFAPSVRIAGYARRRITRVRALECGAVDEVFEFPDAAVRGAGAVVACVPVQTIPGIVREALPGLAQGAVVTDVGSTKANLCRELSGDVADRGGRFVGSHPIAGSELEGLDAARADLYQRAVVVVTPDDGVEGSLTSAKLIGEIWEAAGAMVVTMSPEEHDVILAKTSHLPHMIAALLAATVAVDGELDRKSLFCGQGFHDTTRVAAGSPRVWLDILRTNRKSVYHELTSFRNRLDEVISWLDSKDFPALESFLAESKAVKEQLTANRPERM
jgi:prephenate dehydrogenase